MSLGTWLGCLFGSEPGDGFIEVRYRLLDRPGMGRQFFALKVPESTRALTRFITEQGQQTDVYVAVAPRAREEGTRGAIERVHVLWADVDGVEALQALRSFRPRPSMFVRSGSADSGHAYWALDQPVTAGEAERWNRRLAHSLGADMRSTDAARILRPPGTLNHKHDPPAPVELAHLDIEVFSPAEVVGNLPDPPERRRENVIDLPRRDVSDLRSQETAIALIRRYAPETGLRAGGSGRLHGHCPFPHHEDRNPSFGLFPDGGWVCSCGTGDVLKLFTGLRGEVFTDSLLPTYERELRDELGLQPARAAA